MTSATCGPVLNGQKKGKGSDISHVAAVDCLVTNLDDLDVAADRLGFVLLRGQRTHAWYGRFMNDWSVAQAAATQGFDPKLFGTCLHALRRKDHQAGDYEIGLVARRDGKPGWELVYDLYGPGHKLELAAGKALGTLKDEYAAAGTIKALTKAGYKASRRVNDQGQLQVVGYK